MTLRVVFMGTPQFAATALQALLEAEHEVICVYAQPPRPAGRGYELRKSAVQVLAESKGIPVRTPINFKSTEEQQAFVDLKADVAVVVAYGLLLPKVILDAPRFGCFNIHASLLPRWRGAAPIQRAIMAGDAETGVTIMRMEEGLDTGPIILTKRCPITAETTAATLHDTLAAMGAKAVVAVLKTPEAPGVVQPIDGVTYAKKIDKAETKIDFAKAAVEVRNHIHGLSPFPGAWCFLIDARVKILKARVIENIGDGAPSFQCQTGAIEFLILQREGKGIMDAATFLRGFPLPLGTSPR